MLKIRVQGLIPAGVTFRHVAPPFVVTWMLPSFVPAQSTAALLGEGDSAVIAPRGVGVTVLAYLAALAGTAHVCRARSGLIRVHVCRPSTAFQTTFDAEYSTFGSTAH